MRRRPGTGRAPRGAAPVADGNPADRAGNPRPAFLPTTGGLRRRRCACGRRRPWLRDLLAATGHDALSGLVWLGLTGVALPAEAVDEVRFWCAGRGLGPAPCCTAALPADCRLEDQGD